MDKIKVALQQRVIPNYRAPFFETLGQHPEIELSIYSGKASQNEMIASVDRIPAVNFVQGENIHLLSKQFYICLQPGLLPWLKESDPDVVILEANPRYLSSRKVISWAKKYNKGLIGWGLGIPEHGGRLERFFAIFRKRFLSKFDAILAYSRQGREQYIRAGIPETKVFTAPNSTTARPGNPTPIREPMFPNGHAILLYVGRLQARKRIDSLIQVCSQIPEESQPELWIVGDGEILPELKTAAQKYYPKTRFWGALYGSELEDVFQKADLFVLPGTGGLAIQQAMSQALPVIVAEGDGSQSNMVNPQNGWLIPAKDDLALLAAIQDAIGNPQKLREMGSAAFETISKCANIDIMADIFIQTILKVHNLKSKND